MVSSPSVVSLAAIQAAYSRLRGVVSHTPLMYNERLSHAYEADIYLKREDLQIVRSYKLRGAYNKMALLSAEEQKKGVVCASAGNHAQGFALACKMLNVKGIVFMPTPTPRQKVRKTIGFGGDWVEVRLEGDTFDDAYEAAQAVCTAEGRVFVHPFDDPDVIAGQGTVGLEILQDARNPIDLMLLPVGGGGLSAGVGSCFRELSPNTRLIGIEPVGAPAMFQSIVQDQLVVLPTIDKFVDGAAVKQVGRQTYGICREILSEVGLVDEGKVCETILELYEEEAIVIEPAGALSIAALDQYKDKVKGKTVVCILSGGNNDISRMEEIKERALMYARLKHYFLVRFPQRAGALREFLTHVLGPQDDIVHFEYTKKTQRETGPALVGLEVQRPEDLDGIIRRMKERGIDYQSLNDNPTLFQMLV